MVKAISTPQEFTEILDRTTKEGKVVLVDFWAEWCGPCKLIAPVLQELESKADPSKIEFYKIDNDADAMHNVIQEAGVHALPTFIVYKDGAKVSELKGARKVELTALVQEHSPSQAAL